MGIGQYANPGSFKSSFLYTEKDLYEILDKLFIKSKPYSLELKKLLLISNKDCLDNQKYNKEVERISLADLKEQGYIGITPKVMRYEHEDVKSYILIDFDNFEQTENNKFRDYYITINILSYMDYWDLGDFRLRPLKIAGYIDGILAGAKLSGIGRLEFVGCKQLLLNEELGGYTLMYRAVNSEE